MDEWTLNDLLECSVCLERLDTSSKVLPCQHTFCKRCLQEIVDSHKELRCPECRILVDISIDELPPNVLLMRILEGMKNAPKKRGSLAGGGSVRGPNHSHGAAAVALAAHPGSQHHHHGSAASPAHALPLQRASTANNPGDHASPKQTILPGQPCARALYSYTSPEAGDLAFKKGDLILLKKKVDANWYHGECNGNRGVFPSVYVEVLTSLPSSVPQCKALYDFKMTTDEEEGCLSFAKGEVINVIRRVDENWAEGKLADRIGIFPLAFVELNQVARALMKLSTNAQPGPSRIAPPTPTSEETTPLIPTAELQSHPAPSSTIAPLSSAPAQTAPPTAVAPHLMQRLAGPLSSSSQSPSSSTTPNSSSTSCSSPSSTAPSSPASPPPQQGQGDNPPPPHPRGLASTTSPLAQQPPPQPQHREKRHSLNLLHAANPANLHRLSGEIPAHADLAGVVPESQVSQSSVSGRNHRHRRSISDQPAAALIPNTAGPHAQLGLLPALYIAMYPYKPQKADELELKKGALYTVTEKCQDGWYKGQAQGSHKSGVFPGNYVAIAKTQPHNSGSIGGPGSSRGGGGGSRTNAHNSASSSSWARPFGASINTGNASGAQQPSGGGRQAKNSSTPLGTERPYIDIARSMFAAAQAAMHNVSLTSQSSPCQTPSKSPSLTNQQQLMSPPELPPRASSPATNNSLTTTSSISASWHPAGSSSSEACPAIGRSQSHATGVTAGVGVTSSVAPPPNVSVAASPGQVSRNAADKASKEKKGSGLIRRLTTMKKCKSPPPNAYSMDNPVFEDGTCSSSGLPSMASACSSSSSSALQPPAHTRSGSCPSQLLHQIPSNPDSDTTSAQSGSGRHHRSSHSSAAATGAASGGQSNAAFSMGSQRVKHKERANIVTANPALFSRSSPMGAVSGGAGNEATPAVLVSHRKSSSLDATSTADAQSKKQRQLFPAVKERFRCIVPYPPNSEYELALQVGDVIYVHKKRDDGWYKGTQERTGRVGLFPASFVEAL